MTAKEILKGIAMALLLATAIFHPLCVIAFMSLTIAFRLGEIKDRLVSIGLVLLRGAK